jgi:hypothetical protein
MSFARMTIATLLFVTTSGAWAAVPTEAPKDGDKKDSSAKCEPGKCKCGKCGTSECKCQKHQHEGCPGHQK